MFARLAAVALVALALAWMTVTVGVAGVSRNARPEVALSFAPFDAGALAKQSERQITSGRPSRTQLAEARNFARRALLRDATTVVALRTLAVVSQFERQDRHAARLFHLVQRMSRRDLITQLWMIEERVARNDIRGALHHYDRALRTSRAAPDLLFPILVSATAEDDIVGPLADLLATRPAWRPFFLAKLVENPPSAINAARLTRRLAAEPDMPDRHILARLIPLLADRRETEPAWQIYRALGGSERDALLRNGGFERTNDLPPFDWSLTSELEVSGDPRPAGGERQGSLLEVRASSGHGGRVARQMLRLAPGSYRLVWRAGALEGQAPPSLRWSLTCAAAGDAVLVDQEIQATQPQGSRQAIAFQVPSLCRAQWLDLNLETSFAPGGVAGWIDDVSLAPAPST